MKTIERFPNYSIDETGHIWSHLRGRWLKCTDQRGYVSALLRKNGKAHFVKVHRLVAEAFIPCVEGKTQINHLNGNKKDNRIENLEWVDAGENIRHVWRTGLSTFSEENRKAVSIRSSKPVRNLSSGEVFSSAREASLSLGFYRTTISLAIKLGTRAGGTYWAYV